MPLSIKAWADLANEVTQLENAFRKAWCSCTDQWVPCECGSAEAFARLLHGGHKEFIKRLILEKGKGGAE